MMIFVFFFDLIEAFVSNFTAFLCRSINVAIPGRIDVVIKCVATPSAEKTGIDLTIFCAPLI